MLEKGFLNATLILQLCNPAGENIEVRIADILHICPQIMLEEVKVQS